MTGRDTLRYLGIAALCPLGGFAAFVAYVFVSIGRPAFLESVVVWIFGHPIAVVCATILGLPVLWIQSRRRIQARVALAAFLLVGAAGGAAVYAVLFLGKVWTFSLSLQYVGMGVAVSLFAWVLAVFGPLRLSGLARERPTHAT